MKHINFGVMVDEDSHYPVSYTIKQNGEKVIGTTMLKGGDMTENQIEELYYMGYFKEQPSIHELNSYLDKLNKKRK